MFALGISAGQHFARQSPDGRVIAGLPMLLLLAQVAANVWLLAVLLRLQFWWALPLFAGKLLGIYKIYIRPGR